MEPNIQTPDSEIKFSATTENHIGFVSEKNNDPPLILANVNDNLPNNCCNDTVIKSYQPAPLVLYPPSMNVECNTLKNDVFEEDKAPDYDAKAIICEEDKIPISDEEFKLIKYSRIIRIIIVIKILTSVLYLVIFPPLSPILLLDIWGYICCRRFGFSCLMLYSLYLLVCSFGCVVSAIIFGSWAADIHSSNQKSILFYITGVVAYFAFFNGITSFFIYQYCKKTIPLTKAHISDILKIMQSKRIPFFKFNNP
ncbi:hypothetical protein SteCoe_14801 [Stentor coeruleus]|uniref:Uncharacterized protein n=1 Tax=Stentor coeruleus TaxID=5963 RepID=A0A1R2C554_9CILI|nr:hypothetical protein SteCoe_14801 [Stentor coeruleus]